MIGGFNMSKVFFLSDIHMGALRPPVSPRYGYDWLNPEEKGQLISFLNHVNDHEEDASEIVLVGDILDNWICPHDEQPPSFEEIFNANAAIVTAIKNLLTKGLGVTFLEGNHDMHLTNQDLEKAFGSHDHLRYATKYHDRGVYAEHGHSSDTFNKVPEIGALYNLPLGYFISRVVATKQAIQNSERVPTFEIIKNSLAAFAGRENVAIRVFDTFIDDAGLDRDLKFIMPDGEVIRAEEVRNAYKDTSTSLSVADLKPKAKSLSKDRTDMNVIIFGHTHGGTIVPLDLENEADPLSFDYTKVYANSGTWSASSTPTYVEIEYGDMNHARLMEWREGAPHKIDHKFFAY